MKFGEYETFPCRIFFFVVIEQEVKKFRCRLGKTTETHKVLETIYVSEAVYCGHVFRWSKRFQRVIYGPQQQTKRDVWTLKVTSD
jgi:hypothetical protein